MIEPISVWYLSVDLSFLFIIMENLSSFKTHFIRCILMIWKHIVRLLDVGVAFARMNQFLSYLLQFCYKEESEHNWILHFISWCNIKCCFQYLHADRRRLVIYFVKERLQILIKVKPWQGNPKSRLIKF